MKKWGTGRGRAGGLGGPGGKDEFNLKVLVVFGPKFFSIKEKKKRALRARVSARDFFSKMFFFF